MSSDRVSRAGLLAGLDRRYVWHPFTQMRDWLRANPTVIVEGRGPCVMDARGRRYLDANSSIWTNLHGHQQPRITRAMIRQLKKIAHSSALGLANEPASLLAEKLVKLAPKSLKKVFYSDDGSTAIEAALKMAFQFWRQQTVRRAAERNPEGFRGAPHRFDSRRSFLALENAYHGDTVGAMSLGGMDVFHDTYRPLMFRTSKVMAPYCYRCPFNRAKPEKTDARNHRKCNWECISLVEQKLESEAGGRKSRVTRHTSRVTRLYAAAVIEPLVQGAAGMITHPAGYLKKFSDLCRQHDVLLIADEVMTGFGRTGTLFACEKEKVLPDFLCLAKGLTGGYLPLATTLTSQRVFDAFLGEYAERKTFFHGHSYAANPLGCSAALANLETFDREKTLKTIAARSAELETMLQRFWKLPHVGDVRQVGLVAGVELVRNWKTHEPYRWEDRMGARVCEEAKKQGVLTRPIGNVLVIMPPYCITAAQLEKICDVLKRSIQTVCN